MELINYLKICYYNIIIMTMEMISSFSNFGKTLNVYGTFQEPLFLAKEVGELLGLTNVRMSLASINPNWKEVNPIYTPGGVQKMTFLKEPGLYKLILRSDKKEALKFQEWVCEEVLPSIRKTGQYQLNQHTIRQQLTFKIETEEDLQTKVVNFIKNQFPDSVFVASLGENQDTAEKRIKSHKMGYLKGSPDLIINNLHKHYNGFAIEFKNPKGTGNITEDQNKMIKKYNRNNYKTLVTNNYDECIIELLEYFKHTRISCEFCNCKFKSEKTLSNHHKYFHKII